MSLEVRDIIPILTYGSESGTFSRQAKKKFFENLEMCFYSRLLKIHWTANLSNVNAFKEAKSKTELITTISERQSLFFGHMSTAWKVISTQIYIYCWRSQNVKKHDSPNQSAVHFILILPELIYVIICLLCWIYKIWVLFWTVFISFNVTENYSNLSLVCSSKGWCLYIELAPRIHHPLTFSILYVFIDVGWCSLLSKVTSVSSINPRMI